ncbi:hypothetical protein [Gloeothece verrucosa]|uniref:Uncharacterized protein n=1 Tax=Gloeothece verrucosa (strain PCC 7822) TaxID=497965 RepID=E0U7D9_GLOV7|nr:hypothetical protein [Gloeothece verrucosa]ADN12526.1 hypothetical protein Cyan7822_0483 [Gloeothece verrucosa PCC 7822]
MNMIIPHKQKPFWHRALPIGLGVIAIGSLTAKPVRAGIADFLGNSTFGDIYSQLVSFFPQMIAVDQWISLLENSVNDPCQAVPILFATPSEPGWCTTATDILGGGSMTSVLQDVVGSLGIPDPLQARAQIQEKIDEAGETADPFIINPELYGIELGNLSDRAATSLSAKTVLSDEGQQQIEDEIEQTGEVVQSILDTSDEAQSYDSTQDVVKALARINAQQSVITAMQQASSLRSRTDTQFTNLNLANISRSLDQQNRDKQAQSTVDGFLLLHLTAQSNLF